MQGLECSFPGGAKWGPQHWHPGGVEWSEGVNIGLVALSSDKRRSNVKAESADELSVPSGVNFLAKIWNWRFKVARMERGNSRGEHNKMAAVSRTFWLINIHHWVEVSTKLESTVVICHGVSREPDATNWLLFFAFASRFAVFFVRSCFSRICKVK